MEHTELQKELMAVIEPAQRKFDEGLTEVRELRRELLSKQERGSAPDDTAVRDLEAKLADVEAKQADISERVRLATMAITTATQPEAPRSVWEDAFIRDVPKLMEASRSRDGLERALTSGTTLASAGKLNADQDNQFLDWLIDKTIALSRVTVRRMVSPSAYLDELVTANRKLRAATEATAPTVSDAFTVARRTLAAKETIWGEDVSLSFIEDNIERGNINDHIARNLATAFGNDHNDLFWNGDEDDSDDFLGINDGIIDIAKADASVVDYDASSDTKVQAILAGAHKVFAYDYAARPDLNPAYFLPYATTLVYADELTTRGTAFADNVLLTGLPGLRYFGIPVVAEPHLGGDEGVLTPLQNLVWGVQRGITIESMWNQRKRVVEYTLTARTDQNYAKSAALVLVDGIAAALR
jgi:hypothetical protein